MKITYHLYSCMGEDHPFWTVWRFSGEGVRCGNCGCQFHSNIELSPKELKKALKEGMIVEGLSD